MAQVQTPVLTRKEYQVLGSVLQFRKTTQRGSRDERNQRSRFLHTGLSKIRTLGSSTFPQPEAMIFFTTSTISCPLLLHLFSPGLRGICPHLLNVWAPLASTVNQIVILACYHNQTSPYTFCTQFICTEISGTDFTSSKTDKNHVCWLSVAQFFSHYCQQPKSMKTKNPRAPGRMGQNNHPKAKIFEFSIFYFTSLTRFYILLIVFLCLFQYEPFWSLFAMVLIA